MGKSNGVAAQEDKEPKKRGRPRTRIPRVKGPRGAPPRVPKEEPELVVGLKEEDLSWIPADLNVPENKEAKREMLRVFLACKIVHKGVNDIDRMQIVEFGRMMARKHELDVMASDARKKKDTPGYLRYARLGAMTLSATRQLLRDLRLLRATGLKIKTSTSTAGDKDWEGLL